MNKIRIGLGAVVVATTTVMASESVYAHGGTALHGLIDALVPVGILIVTLLVTQRLLTSRRR